MTNGKTSETEIGRNLNNSPEPKLRQLGRPNRIIDFSKSYSNKFTIQILSDSKSDNKLDRRCGFNVFYKYNQHIGNKFDQYLITLVCF